MCSWLLPSFLACGMFLTGALSSMPAVRTFSLYAGTAVLINFLLQVSFQLLFSAFHACILSYPLPVFLYHFKWWAVNTQETQTLYSCFKQPYHPSAELWWTGKKKTLIHQSSPCGLCMSEFVCVCMLGFSAWMVTCFFLMFRCLVLLSFPNCLVLIVLCTLQITCFVGLMALDIRRQRVSICLHVIRGPFTFIPTPVVIFPHLV